MRSGMHAFLSRVNVEQQKLAMMAIFLYLRLLLRSYSECMLRGEQLDGKSGRVVNRALLQ